MPVAQEMVDSETLISIPFCIRFNSVIGTVLLPLDPSMLVWLSRLRYIVIRCPMVSSTKVAQLTARVGQLKTSLLPSIDASHLFLFAHKDNLSGASIFLLAVCNVLDLLRNAPAYNTSHISS